MKGIDMEEYLRKYNIKLRLKRINKRSPGFRYRFACEDREVAKYIGMETINFQEVMIKEFGALKDYIWNILGRGND